MSVLTNMQHVDPDPARAIEAVAAGFAASGYICTRQIATAVYLGRRLEKPILVEGPAGVGKTELAKAAAHFSSLPLIRMQCYEGLDESKALYEWEYGKQLLYTQILKDTLRESFAGGRRPRRGDRPSCAAWTSSSSPSSSSRRGRCCARCASRAARCC